MAVVAAGALALQPTLALALPQGGVVSAGSASISSAANQTTITQSSNRAILDWNSFDIAAGERVQVNQPGSSSIELERIHGGNATSIEGSLSSNGQVWLLNSQGVMFGGGAQVNVAGLLASTSDISNGNFMAGNYRFDTPGNAGASIVNNGHIAISDSGLAALVGPHVTNNGLIEARLGKVQLASGDLFTVDLYGDGLINLAASPAITSQLVSNGGTITADGGSILLTEAAAENTLNSQINMTGTLQADTIGTNTGAIAITGQGSNSQVTVPGNIYADGGTTGNGGNVSITSGGTTSFSGNIYARGGSDAGNGGEVETSGGILSAIGHVITTAAHGITGDWLLDPATINVITGGGSDPTASTVDPSTIVTDLNGTNINLQADESITVSNAINASGNASAGNLVLNAPTDYLNAPITLKSGSTLSGNATTVNVGANGLIQNGIDAAAAAATVNLAAATYDLPSELVINKDLTLTGQSAASTILDGQNTTRVMEIDGGSPGVDVTIDNLTMDNGNGVGTSESGNGGALLVVGDHNNVTINNTTVTNNSVTEYAGGIYMFGFTGSSEMTINDGTIANNSASASSGLGGGILNQAATLVVNNSVIAANSSEDGAGILNYAAGVNATTTINNSTLVENAATSYGGAVFTYGLNATATTTITNSTITANSATNGGALSSYSTGNTYTTIRDSILAGNAANGSENEFYNLGGSTLTSNGYDLFGQNGNAGGFTGNGTTDIKLSGGICTAVNCSGGVPTLANNGGPTQTLALVSGSAAIGAGGAASAYEIDQRGYARNLSGDIDIGAYEYSSPGNPFDVTLTSDSSGTNIGELRTALNYSNNNPTFNPTITFDPSDFSTVKTITLTQGELVIGSSLTLDGPTAGIILDANNNSRVMEIDGTTGGITVNVSDLTMQHGNGHDTANVGAAGAGYNGFGGGLMIFSGSGDQTDVAINDSTISDSSASVVYGGGIYSVARTSGTTTEMLNNSTISGNSATEGGGLFISTRGTAVLTVDNSTISDNTASSSGGGIYNYNYGGNVVLAIGNTILAANTFSSSEDDFDNSSGTLTSNGYNLFGQNGNAGGFVGNGTTDIQLSGGICTALYCASTTPTLANSGGPTETIAIVSGGPAIGAGDPSLLGTDDQTGTTRSGAVDIGAVQYSGGGTTNVGTVDIIASSQEILYGNNPGLTAVLNTTYTCTGAGCADIGGLPSLTINGVTISGTSGYYNAGVWASAIVASSGTLSFNSGFTGSFSYTAGTLTVDQAPITVKAASNTKIYNGDETASATPTIISGSLVTGDTGNFTESYTTANVGTGLTLTPTGSVSDGNLGGNYNVTFENSANGIITQRTVTVDPTTSQGKIYGQTDPTLTYSTAATTGTTGLVNSDTLSGDISRNSGENVGTYAFTLGTLANSNYNIVMEASPPTFAITRRTVTVDPTTSQGKIYGTTDPTLTHSTAAATGTTGLVNSDSLTGDVSRASGENAGTYAFTLGTLANSNYNIVMESSPPTFAVTQRSVTIDPTEGQTKIYGQSDPTLTYSTAAATGTTGLVNSDTLTGDISRAAGENVGTYAFTLGTLANSNYTIALESSPPTFSITAYALSVDANAQSKTAGQSDPALTYSYGSLQNGDTSSLFSGALTRAAGETDGQYAISQGTLSAGSNYTVDFTGNSLTISGGGSSSPTASTPEESQQRPRLSRRERLPAGLHRLRERLRLVLLAHLQPSQGPRR